MADANTVLATVSSRLGQRPLSRLKQIEGLSRLHISGWKSDPPVLCFVDV
jgi:hypothetical protein